MYSNFSTLKNIKNKITVKSLGFFNKNKNLNHAFEVFHFGLLNVKTYSYQLVTHSIEHIKISASKSKSKRNGSKLALASSYTNEMLS